MNTFHEYPSFIKSLGEPEISGSHVQTQAERGVPIRAAFLLQISYYSWQSLLPSTTWSIEVSPSTLWSDTVCGSYHGGR